jgi:hypothetical protein
MRISFKRRTGLCGMRFALARVADDTVALAGSDQQGQPARCAERKKDKG